ncbi:hypothetical protein CO057_02290 [Candidatus Uhrbacteria bacterium CG_4_9_14_0_2_um_filter_41_50]|uniref:Uncharacterized protein n=1 Tax=Candidatus Uhrbacteria bacterium CG_4_9_14_0_2_um_filter_41_50 TaxID=1975031 RepID=A0A2M8EP74_9BACT|nr:MAG: hypothetical protein COZ45_03090 [Candidatus Uhrbacteria bacterium CG_4_10_14_3_um_filter_41_21]PIZ55451.1 MAG: hypothetical protein COY24_00275 [Candidatus Uhrbacteria bacterium CG_4_10_14_0_2_um_filter_41_21]PJB84632.1 MAG: hypothetical protein CO086_02630 [Candidatus Uhrbacteria bacterium CG_4_9_14_0_8_um_filter_41_16]PJC24539.1 MAG: hypothetical protein CO057_02290 [Candidatus Uhrbacteria bacterium CG_4_9_14_0_2_um_filter_41_50]PJE75388.1 MAG: hypothetical protein COV03_00440 [Candi
MRQFLFAIIGVILFTPTLALARLSADDTGLNTTGSEVYGDTAPDIGTFIGSNIITPALSLVGVIFLVLVIYGGFLWMTAGGTEAQVTKAKNIIISAVIGAVLIAAAYAITSFVFQSLS